jgi:hypothetical protein
MERRTSNRRLLSVMWSLDIRRGGVTTDWSPSALRYGVDSLIAPYLTIPYCAYKRRKTPTHADGHTTPESIVVDTD